MRDTDRIVATVYHGPTGKRLARVEFRGAWFQGVGPLQLPCLTRGYQIVDGRLLSGEGDRAELFVRALAGWQSVARVLTLPNGSQPGAMAFG